MQKIFYISRRQLTDVGRAATVPHVIPIRIPQTLSGTFKDYEDAELFGLTQI